MPQDRWNEDRGRRDALHDRERRGYDEFAPRREYEQDYRGGSGDSYGQYSDYRDEGRSFDRSGGGRYGGGQPGTGQSATGRYGQQGGGSYGGGGQGGGYAGGYGGGSGRQGQDYGQTRYAEPGFNHIRNSGQGSDSYAFAGRQDREAWSRGRGPQSNRSYGAQDEAGVGYDYAGQGGFGVSHDYEPGADFGDYERHRRHGEHHGRDDGRSWMERTGQRLGEFFSGHRGRGPKNYARSDDRVREDVNDRLTDDPWVDASEIDVQVTSGEVTLSGTVTSREDKRRAEDLAEQVSGVKHVQNNLRVQAQQTGASTGSGSTYSGSGAVDIGGATGVTGTTAAGSSAASSTTSSKAN